MKTLTKFVVFCIAVIILYIITAIMFQYTTGNPLPDSLTMGIFGFFGTELCVSGVLKVFKIKKENTNEY